MVDANKTNEDTVVDCDILLASKENIQPLSKGRSAKALSAVFSTPLVRRDAHLAKQKEWYKQQVKGAVNEPDPLKLLEAYDRFINWTIESYPQGDSAESGIVELIEEATRLLKELHSPAINQNESYLRMWLLYADYVERPTIIYSFLLSNEIGTEHSTFYESYTDDLERSKRYREADEIYNLGIARKATPLIRLETRYRSFKRRMLTSSDAATSGGELDTENPSASSQPRPPTKRERILGSSTLTGDSTRTAPLGNTLSIKMKPKANSCFIYSDEAALGGDEIEISPWADIGTKQSRRKENIRQVTKAGDGVPLLNQKSHRVVSAPGRSNFVPFVDEGLETLDIEGLPEPTRGLSALNTPDFSQRSAPYDTNDDASSSLLRVKIPSQLTESEALKKDPLKNYNIS